ncbi:MAG: DUF268 domain-containing protein [Armatimonadota bacterium]
MKTIKKSIKKLPGVMTAKRLIKSIPMSLAVTRDKALFLRDFERFKALSRGSDNRFCMSWSNCRPCLGEATADAGFDRHYLYHTSWAARIVADIKPEVHIDISSQLQFSTLVSAFVPVKFYDYRPADIKLDNLTTGAADVTALQFENKSINSLSCMHVVEHIGLGRYGDPLDPDGDLKACVELQRVLNDGGSLLFVVPVGKPQVVFNAHRIYSYEQVISMFAELELVEFVMIPDDVNTYPLLNPRPEIVMEQEFGCGCFWFQRK